jgi:hypothetical protein
LGLGLSGLECLSAVKELFRITGQKVPFPAQYVPITYLLFKISIYRKALTH